MDRFSLVRLVRRAFLQLGVLGVVALVVARVVSSRPLLVVAFVLLGLSALPLALYVGLCLPRLPPALAGWRERRRRSRALARLDKLEAGGTEDEFAALCAQVRERIGSAVLDARLAERGRAARARYLPHATMAAVERMAASGDDPLAGAAGAEAARRRETNRGA